MSRLGEDNPNDVVSLVRRFSLTGLAATALVMPFAALGWYDTGTSLTAQMVGGTVFAALLAAGAFVPWQRVLGHRLGRTLFDLQAIATLTTLAVVDVVAGPALTNVIGMTMIATFAAFHVTRAGLVSIATILGATAVAALVGAADAVARTTVLSLLIVTLILMFVARSTVSTLRASLDAQARAREKLERRAAHLEVVARTARQVTTIEPQGILEVVAHSTEELDWDLCGIYVEAEAGGMLRYAAHHNLPDDVVDRRFPRDVGAVGRVFAAGETVVMEDYGASPDANRLYAERGVQTAVGVPIVVHGELVGVIVVGSHHAFSVEDTHLHVLELLAAQAGRAIELAERHAEQAETIDELRALDRMKNDFLATVSHELRSPLTVILGLAKTMDLRRSVLDDNLLDEMIRRLRRNATSLDEIISTLLDVRRLEDGALRLEHRPVRLTDVAGEVAERVGPLLEHHQVELDWDGPVWVDGDRVLLGRVIENLLANAARHTPPGTQVTVTVRAMDGRASLAVRDDGPGISAADLERIGERFFRGGDPDARPRRGIGLGLAFCRQVLDLHGSALQISSEPGRGTEFSFELPVLERDGAHAAAPTG